MGLSFEANNAPKLAERNYKEALKVARARGQGELQSPCTTASAASPRRSATSEAAEEHYNEVAANDYTYLDVAQRLRRLI